MMLVVGSSWSDDLWTEGAPIYAAILEHPFLTGLADGDLPADRFAYFLAQDAHYLREYARALAVLAAKAPTHADAGMLARHVSATVEVELALHESLLPQLGIANRDLDRIAVSPTTLSYTSYLLASTYGGSFAEGLAAVLPCYWIYARVGAALAERGSPDPRYQLWIDSYASTEFAQTVTDILALADRVGPGLGADEHARAHRHFTITSRYEWMFWDAAWRLEQWPLDA
jgi:thiaminase/transcriptional activator TenA